MVKLENTGRQLVPIEPVDIMISMTGFYKTSTGVFGYIPMNLPVWEVFLYDFSVDDDGCHVVCRADSNQTSRGFAYIYGIFEYTLKT